MGNVPTIFLADADLHRRRAAIGQLGRRANVRSCETVEDLVRALAGAVPNVNVVVIGALGQNSSDSVNAAHLVHEICPEIRMIFVADSSSEEVAIGALRAGVSEYLKAPVDALEIAEAIGRVLPSINERADKLEQLVGAAPEIREIKLLIQRIAPLNGTVLITGESGSGKEVVARLIHQHSGRARLPFVCVNCAAIPDALFESELFGHERGAFTGAVSRQLGQMRIADGGTLFLDEIGDMTALAQSKMLRVLEQREIQPLGASKPVPVDIRLVTATNRDLEKLVAEEKFRADLFYRLDVTRIHLPPLRERRSDIPALAMHFVREMNGRYGRHIEGFTRPALQRLTDHDWPGNIRQLRNTIESASVICESSLISDGDLRVFRSRAASPSPAIKTLSVISPPTEPVQPRKDALLEALQATHWNMTRTAELLKWSRSTVYRQLSKYQIERPDSVEKDDSADVCSSDLNPELESRTTAASR